MFAMWWVMMAAMMLPSAAPMLLLFARIHRGERAGGRSYVPTGIFAAGYLVVWGGFSALATAAAMGSAADRSAVADDGDLEPAARCYNPDRCGSVAADADQAHLPAALPLAAGVSRHELAAREVRRLSDGS